MGLINVTHTQVTQSILDLQQDLLKNQYYLFNNMKALPVDYFNINTNRSTLDQALAIQYANLGTESPLRFNLIHDLYLYGLDRIALNLDYNDSMVEASEISGEAVITPNTIIPYPGDYFIIQMIGSRYLFQVNKVDKDTLDNGANYYKINYKLQYQDHDTMDRLLPLVVDENQFVSGNVGSNFSPVISKAKYDLGKILDDTSVMLKKYFDSLYFNNKVQTYTFVHLYHVCRTNMNSDYFYDPYMIEFIIKNNVLSNMGDKYLYIDHKTTLRADFPIKYNRSIWKVIENRNKSELTSCKTESAGQYIDDPATIFSTRYENYFELNYNDPIQFGRDLADTINIIPNAVIGHIINNQLFDIDSEYSKYNLLIKYFNNKDISAEDLLPLNRITELDNDNVNYFALPMIIFVLDTYIKKLMTNNNKYMTETL